MGIERRRVDTTKVSRCRKREQPAGCVCVLAELIGQKMIGQKSQNHYLAN